MTSEPPPPAYTEKMAAGPPPMNYPPAQGPPPIQHQQAIPMQYQQGGYGGAQPVMHQPTPMQMGAYNRALMNMLPMKLGRDPVHMKCPNCHQDVMTETRTTMGACQWIIFAILCSFLLFFVAWIPFCMDSLKDTVHSCPHCKGYVGFHRVYAPGY